MALFENKRPKKLLRSFGEISTQSRVQGNLNFNFLLLKVSFAGMSITYVFREKPQNGIQKLFELDRIELILQKESPSLWLIEKQRILTRQTMSGR